MKVRLEKFDGTVKKYSVAEAVELFGKSELFEYLQGYSHSFVVFLETDEGKPVYPVTMEHLEL